MTTKFTERFTWTQIAKGIVMIVPILGLLLAGYLNIMVKLTSLEEKITFGQQTFITLQNDIKDLRLTDIKIQQDLIDHRLQTDDTYVKPKGN